MVVATEMVAARCSARFWTTLEPLKMRRVRGVRRTWDVSGLREFWEEERLTGVAPAVFASAAKLLRLVLY